ncbi:hypothetical protein GC175_09555 [bacterium]|nr:hypothetical protein [bacterium]
MGALRGEGRYRVLGDWGLGTRDRVERIGSPIHHQFAQPSPQSPIPSPQSPIPNPPQRSTYVVLLLPLHRLR